MLSRVKTRKRSESEYIRQVNGLGDGDGLGRKMGCMREMADALWEGHTLLKTGLSAHRHTHTGQIETKVKTVYPPDLTDITSTAADADGPRDAASYPIDHRAVLSWTPSVINRRRSAVDVESTWLRLPLSLGVNMVSIAGELGVQPQLLS